MIKKSLYLSTSQQKKKYQKSKSSFIYHCHILGIIYKKSDWPKQPVWGISVQGWKLAGERLQSLKWC